MKFKKIFNNVLNQFGYKIEKNKLYNFDHIYKKYFNNNEKKVLFDVGANEGQTLKRFVNLCDNFEIHAFEPISKVFDSLRKNFSNNTHIKINNFALGDKIEKKKIKVFKNSANSSFNGPIKNSLWEQRKRNEAKSSEIISMEEEVDVFTIDNYCLNNNIIYLDLLKIDVQGWEEKILIGAITTLQQKKIKFIEIEFIMGDQYENRLNVIDLEKYLIPNNFRLFGISQKGDLLNKSYISLDLLYANTDCIKVK